MLRLLAAMSLLLACSNHECEMDADCPPSDAGCAVPATGCVAPMIPACREYRCSEVCACGVGR